MRNFGAEFEWKISTRIQGFLFEVYKKPLMEDSFRIHCFVFQLHSEEMSIWLMHEGCYFFENQPSLWLHRWIANTWNFIFENILIKHVLTWAERRVRWSNINSKIESITRTLSRYPYRKAGIWIVNK